MYFKYYEFCVKFILSKKFLYISPRRLRRLGEGILRGKNLRFPLEILNFCPLKSLLVAA